jgi:hypothetical protein
MVGSSKSPEKERGNRVMLGKSASSRLCRAETAPRMRQPLLWLALLLLPSIGFGQQHFHGDRALEITRQFVSIGPRWCLSPGHAKAEEFLRNEFKHDQLEEDTFTANTPIGPVPMRNFIVRFPGKKDGVIVLTTHYETNYPLRNIGFVGANDGGSTTGLLIEIANEIRGKTLDGYSVWLVFFDGEEAIERWQGTDNTYGSRHLAAKWGQDGTLKRIKAFMLADMLGDKDLERAEREPVDAMAGESGIGGGSKYRIFKILFSERRRGFRRSLAVCAAWSAIDRRDRHRLWSAQSGIA